MSDVNLDSRISELLKIARSFIYFVLNYCYIRSKDEESGSAEGEMPFRMWPDQERSCKVFLTKTYIAILKARQLGLTWLSAAYSLWRCILSRHFLAVVISANEEWASEFIERVRFMHQRLPNWLQRPLSKDGSQNMQFVFEWDEDGKKPLVYSEIKSLTTTPSGAQSKTPNLLIMDETARNRYASEIFGASKPGIDKAGGQIIVISNAHKRGVGWGWTRAICRGAWKRKNGFHLMFLPWWACPDRLEKWEKILLARNKDFIPTSFIEKQRADGMEEADITENYPSTVSEALSTRFGSYFGDVLDRHSRRYVPGHVGMLKRDRQGDYTIESNKSGILEIWRYPYFLHHGWRGVYYQGRYCIGSDISEGTGNTNSVAYVMDRLLDELIAVAVSNKIDAVRWAALLWHLSRYYCNFHLHAGGTQVKMEPAIICVERTGAGITAVQELEKVNANQFVRVLEGKVGDSVTTEIGWHESRQSKHLLCSQLRNWLRTTRGGFFDTSLADECSTTVERDDGSIGPEDSRTQWDRVVAAGCTVQASMQLKGPPQRLQIVDGYAAGGLSGPSSLAL